MKLWPFNRNKNESSDLPQEVQDYYQAEKREKVGVAGLLALGTLVVTILLAIGLFFGGRWAYRAVFDNNDDKQVAQQEDGEQQEEENAEESAGDDEPAEEEAAPTPNEAQPSPAPTTISPDPNPTPTPATNNTADLPSTGPEDNLAIFLGTVIAASTIFYLVRQPAKE